MTNPNLIVVSGGPGSGKTTVLRELARRGFRYAPEVARQIIQEQVQTGGSALPWADRAAYAELMLERSIQAFAEYTPAARPVFADRGIPDTLCYARLIGLREIRSIEMACRSYRYAPFVFLAPPWPEIYTTDGERKQDFVEAEQTYEIMTTVYRELGYDVVVLPKATPGERADFVIHELAARAGPA